MQIVTLGLKKILLLFFLLFNFLIGTLLYQNFYKDIWFELKDFNIWKMHIYEDSKQYQYISDHLAEALDKKNVLKSRVYQKTLLNNFDLTQIPPKSLINILTGFTSNNNSSEVERLLKSYPSEDPLFTKLTEYIDPHKIINDLFTLIKSNNEKDFKNFLDKIRNDLSYFYTVYEINISELKNREKFFSALNYLEEALFFKTEESTFENFLETTLEKSWTINAEDFTNNNIKGFYTVEAASLSRIASRVKIKNFNKELFLKNFSAAIFQIINAIFHLGEKTTNTSILVALSEFKNYNRDRISKLHAFSIREYWVKGFRNEAIDEIIRILKTFPPQYSANYLFLPTRFYLEDPSFTHRKNEIEALFSTLLPKIKNQLPFLKDRYYYLLFNKNEEEAFLLFKKALREKNGLSHELVHTFCKGRTVPQKKPEFTISCFEESIKYSVNIENFEPYKIYGNLGQAYAEAGKTKKAKELFLISKEITDRNNIIFSCTHAGLGLIFLNENNLDKAETLFTDLIREQPEKETNYINLSTIYFKKNQPEKAIQILADGCRQKIKPELFYPVFENKSLILVPELKKSYKIQFLKRCTL